MKVTKELAKQVKEYIFKEKRSADIIGKQLYKSGKNMPFIVYAVGLQKGFKFTYSTEAALDLELKSDSPRFIAYCKIDRGLYNLYQMHEYKEITLETYIDKTVQYIQGTMVERKDAKNLIAVDNKKRKEFLKNNS